MKIAIPASDGKLCMHFGHCEKFVLIDVDQASKTITAKAELVPPPHEPGLLPKWLGEQKADMIIAGGMGQRAKTLFDEQNISVIVGAPVEVPENIVYAYLNNKLEQGVNVCDH